MAHVKQLKESFVRCSQCGNRIFIKNNNNQITCPCGKTGHAWDVYDTQYIFNRQAMISSIKGIINPLITSLTFALVCFVLISITVVFFIKIIQWCLFLSNDEFDKFAPMGMIMGILSAFGLFISCIETSENNPNPIPIYI